MTAKSQLGARGAIDVGDVDAAAVEIEAQPFERRDAHMAAVAAADRRMMRVHRQVGDMDRVAGIAAERDRIARQGLVADDLLARLRRRDAAQDETHRPRPTNRTEEHTSELQSLMRISYAVFCLNQK